MKRFWAVVSIILTIAVSAIIAYNAGIRHAIVESEIWAEATEENDHLIHIVVDGNEYLHIG